MDRIQVVSSDIASIGYDEDAQTLLVEFIKTGDYVYHGVPREIFDAFLEADSKGKFLAQNIKGQFDFSKL